MDKPALFGIEHSNRDKKGFWGKNMFNSSFPVALANYMKESNKKAIYIYLNAQLETETREIDISEVYNCGTTSSKDLYFAFESKFAPYSKFAYDDIGNIDLVVKNLNGDFLRPLEVKLTVLPDKASCTKGEDKWGSEIVIRPATTSYCALGIASACETEFDKIRDIFEDTCIKIRDWSNPTEIITAFPSLLECVNTFEKEFVYIQSPLIMQPVWKTKGQSPILAENAFDIYIWSDLAFTRLFLDNKADAKITRQMRCTARLARCLFELSRVGKVSLRDIYKQMTFDLQTDKEFAANGSITNKYMANPRLTKPLIMRDELYNIILNNGEDLLQPERRFDQSIYFTMKRNG